MSHGVRESQSLGSRRSSTWSVFDASVWLAGIAVGALRSAEFSRASVFAAIFAVFCAYRFASAVSLAGLSGVSATSPYRRVRAAAWLWISRTLATGLLFVSLSLGALVLYPHGLGIVLGVIGLLVGQAFLIFGVQLLRAWKAGGANAEDRAKRE